MKKINIIALMALIITTITTSCSSDDDNGLDNEIPTVEIMEPHESDMFEPGQELHVHAMLGDNVELSEVKIDIHYAGDGHEHRPLATLNDDQEHAVEWSNELIKSISGSDYELDEVIMIPEQIEHDGEMHSIKHGEYHFGIFVIDASGNEAQAFLDFVIEGHHNGDGDGHDHG